MITTSSYAGDHRLSDFMRARRRLFGVAYRILGSAAEAEDLVQDVWLRWQRTDHTQVLNAPAFLAVMTTRLAINRARALSSRREAQDETSMSSEPVDVSASPGLKAERGQELELAIALLIEKLSARERAAYVLREAFNYPYLHIAALLGVREVTCRQLVTRARKHIADQRRASVVASDHRRLFMAFLDAARTGEVTALEGLFAAEVAAC
jgi:RNA polymerase sigma-70 factor (ECF subfamily)